MDGIHTDGSYYVGDMGEFKRYHASDGADNCYSKICRICQLRSFPAENPVRLQEDVKN